MVDCDGNVAYKKVRKSTNATDIKKVKNIYLRPAAKGKIKSVRCGPY